MVDFLAGARLQLFTCDGFSTPDDFAQPNFLPRPFFFSSLLLLTKSFHTISASLLCLRPFILVGTQPPPTPALGLLHPPSFSPLLYSTSLISTLPPSPRRAQNALHHNSSHNTISSHVGRTCRHLSATFDHCFYRGTLISLRCLGGGKNER